jgi:hypothetical protein
MVAGYARVALEPTLKVCVYVGRSLVRAQRYRGRVTRYVAQSEARATGVVEEARSISGRLMSLFVCRAGLRKRCECSLRGYMWSKGRCCGGVVWFNGVFNQKYWRRECCVINAAPQPHLAQLDWVSVRRRCSAASDGHMLNITTSSVNDETLGAQN